MKPHNAENGTPIPTNQRYKFTTDSGCYICSGCGSLVGAKVADVRQHEAWHDLLARVLPPGQGR